MRKEEELMKGVLGLLIVLERLEQLRQRILMRLLYISPDVVVQQLKIWITQNLLRFFDNRVFEQIPNDRGKDIIKLSNFRKLN